MRTELLSYRYAPEFAPVLQANHSPTQRAKVDQLQTELARGVWNLQPSPCPCGGSAEDTLIARIDRYGLPLDTVLCESCGTLRIDPYFTAEALDRFYQSAYLDLYGWAPDKLVYFNRQRGYGERVLATYAAKLPKEASVLEIGCGAGGGLEPFDRLGHLIAGCEPNAELVKFGRSQHMPDLWAGTLNAAPKSILARKFDIIFLHHVFEHVGDPAAEVQRLTQLLRPGGRVLVIVPDISRVEQFANPNGNIQHFLHVAHKFNYTTCGLERIAASVNCTAKSVTPAAHLTTEWAQMPELWVEFTPGSSATNTQPLTAHGPQMLAYLQRTEQDFLERTTLRSQPTAGRFLDRLTRAFRRAA